MAMRKGQSGYTLHSLAEAMREHRETDMKEVLRAACEEAIRVGDVDLVLERFIRRAA